MCGVWSQDVLLEYATFVFLNGDSAEVRAHFPSCCKSQDIIVPVLLASYKSGCWISWRTSSILKTLTDIKEKEMMRVGGMRNPSVVSPFLNFSYSLPAPLFRSSDLVSQIDLNRKHL